MRGLYLNFGLINTDIDLEDGFIQTSETNEKIYVFVDGDLMKVKVKKALGGATQIDVQTWYDLRTDVDLLKERMDRVEPSVTDLEKYAIKKVEDLAKNNNYFWRDTSGVFTNMVIPVGSKTIYEHPNSSVYQDNRIVIGYDLSTNNTIIETPILTTAYVSDIGYNPHLSDENNKGLVNFNNVRVRSRYYKETDGIVHDIWSYTKTDGTNKINEYPIGNDAWFSNAHVETDYYIESPDGNVKRKKRSV